MRDVQSLAHCLAETNWQCAARSHQHAAHDLRLSLKHTKCPSVTPSCWGEWWYTFDQMQSDVNVTIDQLFVDIMIIYDKYVFKISALTVSVSSTISCVLLPGACSPFLGLSAWT